MVSATIEVTFNNTLDLACCPMLMLKVVVYMRQCLVEFSVFLIHLR